MIKALSLINGNIPMVRSPSRSNPNLSRFIVVSMATSQSYWTSVNAEIEAHLKKAIPVKPPVSVSKPMNHLVFDAPRTTAPALCIAACELVGGHRDQAMAAASALHIMHATAFTHEQLPLMDGSNPKLNIRPKSKHAFGPNIELLTGDGMLPFGIELLTKDDPAQNNSERILRVIIEITRTMGSQGIIEGQYNESQYSKSNDEELSHVTLIDKIYKKKEGELHACASVCGAILGGGSEEEIEKLRRYGLCIGVIQGILYNMDDARQEKWAMEEAKRLRKLAVEELKDFNEEKVEAISSILETMFGNV